MRFLNLLALCAVGAALLNAQQQRNYKDRQEYDLYTEITKDFNGSNFASALSHLDQWKEKYPDSEFRDERQMLYVQAYAGAKQSGRVLDVAGAVLSTDAFNSADPASALRVLYAAVSAVQRVAEPTAQQLATAEQAAKRLEIFDTAPPGVSASAWASTRAELRSAATSALVYVALVPASRAIKANDCRAGEMAAMKTMELFPDSVQAAWFLGLADVCTAKTDSTKASIALYELARAAGLDPTKGMVDPKWQQSTVVPYLEKVYAQFHGPDPEGLKELKELSVQSPFPPSGFHVKSVAELARERAADFEAKHPELALWRKIKTALSGDDGEHYFESELKGAAVPELQGTLLAAKPVCGPTELSIAVPLPDDSQSPREEILLKLEKRLPGKLALQTKVHWSGIPLAFSREPFLLTMEVGPADLKGTEITPCQPAVRPGTRHVSSVSKDKK